LEIELEEVQVKRSDEWQRLKNLRRRLQRFWIGAQEEAELQKLLESAVRLRINYSKLVQQ